MMERNGLYLDKTNPMPLYEQLRRVLSEAIISGKISEGTKLPTEEELCEQLEISRTVVRQAYGALISDGYVERMRGKGTFVQRINTRGRFLNIQLSFEKEMAILGLSHETKMLREEWIAGDLLVADNLKIGIDEKCYHITRMRHAGGKPFVLVENYIPIALFPGLEKYNLAKYSLYSVYEKEYHVKIMRARRAICARTADAEFEKQFHVPQGSPVLYITNVAYDQYERPVDFSKEYLDGGVQKFEFDVVNK